LGDQFKEEEARKKRDTHGGKERWVEVRLGKLKVRDILEDMAG
jgi:hypothetical protein